MSAGDHFICPPSSAPRRIQCTQSSTLEALFPEQEDDTDAREGVAAHWAVAEMLAGRLVDVGEVAPNGVILTDEMIDGCDRMHDDVTKALAPYGLKPSNCCIEARVFMPRVYPGMFGSPDCYILIARPGLPNLLLLWDYKFGHRYVEVFENAQMVDYIAGITDGIHDMTPGVDIVVTIVQPRSFSSDGPIRRWETTLLKLRALINVSSNAVHEALGPNPRAKVGPECRDCKARHACPTLQREGFAGMDEAKRVTPMEMTPAAAGLELRMLERSIALLTARSKGLEAQLERMAKSGAPTPGWRLVPGESRETWTVPEAQVIATAALLRVNVAKPPEAITPAQARKAGLDPDLVAALAARGPAGMKLVADDGSAARRAFG